MYYIIEKQQVYDTDQRAFVAAIPPEAPPDTVTTLYMDTTNPNKLILADTAFLRSVLLSFGHPLGEALKTRLDAIQDIQAEYAPQLTLLQEAKAGAEMRDDTENVTAIKAEYVALLQEMNDKIQEASSD